MLVFLYRLLLALSISISVSCESIDCSVDILKFKEEWDYFIQSKEMTDQRIDAENHLEYEFSLLQEFSDRQSIRHRPYIEAMDRFQDCRPYVENKMTLSDGTEMSASFIHLIGLKEYHHFIATQAPFKHNIYLFWQMVVENQVDQIVMLTELFDIPSKELAYPYWPEKIDEKLSLENGLEVTLIEERELLSELTENIQIRKFHIHHQGKDKWVIHYWYRNWKDYTAPNQSQTILTLIHAVEKDKNSLESNAPIMVHCAAGVGRTGVFITLYHLTQRIKHRDQKMDLFDLVAYLRWQRPYLVGALSQYKFCHEVNQMIQQSQ